MTYPFLLHKNISVVYFNPLYEVICFIMQGYSKIPKVRFGKYQKENVSIALFSKPH